MLDKTYDPRSVEAELYAYWENAGLFKPDVADPQARPFSIVIPPPNVTGALHMGHALDNVLQDALTRWRRMQGCRALWMPGTDHAGIATQSVVERQLKAEGLTRQGLGREAFLARVWQWANSCKGGITGQLRRLGVSPDWSRERFTLDEGAAAPCVRRFTRCISAVSFIAANTSSIGIPSVSRPFRILKRSMPTRIVFCGKSPIRWSAPRARS